MRSVMVVGLMLALTLSGCGAGLYEELDTRPVVEGACAQQPGGKCDHPTSGG